MSNQDGEAGRRQRSNCCAGGFSFYGRTPQADRDIWFIHEGGPLSRLVTGAWEQLDPMRPLPEFSPS